MSAVTPPLRFRKYAENLLRDQVIRTCGTGMDSLWLGHRLDNKNYVMLTSVICLRLTREGPLS